MLKRKKSQALDRYLMSTRQVLINHRRQIECPGFAMSRFSGLETLKNDVAQLMHYVGEREVPSLVNACSGLLSLCERGSTEPTEVTALSDSITAIVNQLQSASDSSDAAQSGLPQIPVTLELSSLSDDQSADESCVASDSRHFLKREHDFEQLLGLLDLNRTSLSSGSKSSYSGFKENSTLAMGESIRVDARCIDQILERVNELIIVRNRLKRLGVVTSNREAVVALTQLERVMSQLHNTVVEAGKQPASQMLGRTLRLGKSMAEEQKKQIDIQLLGHEVELDATIIEALNGIIPQLVCNAIQYRIESPIDRLANRKPALSRLHVTIENKLHYVRIVVTDDGRGFNPLAIKDQALKMDIIDAKTASTLSMQECLNLVFLLKENTHQLAENKVDGGLELSNIRQVVKKLQGDISIQSVMGKGSTITIELPSNVIHTPVFIAQLDRQYFAFPSISVERIVTVDRENLVVSKDQKFLTLDGRKMGLFSIAHWLDAAEDGVTHSDSPSTFVIVLMNQMRIALSIDQEIGYESLGVKPIPKEKKVSGISGIVTTRDGFNACVLDIEALFGCFVRQDDWDLINRECNT